MWPSFAFPGPQSTQYKSLSRISSMPGIITEFPVGVEVCQMLLLLLLPWQHLYLWLWYHQQVKHYSYIPLWEALLHQNTYLDRDPVQGYVSLQALRERDFRQRYPDMHVLFVGVLHGNPSLFKQALLYFIMLTNRFSSLIWQLMFCRLKFGLPLFLRALYPMFFSGGSKNFERGVQLWVHKAHPKIFGLPRPLPDVYARVIIVATDR